MKPLELLSLPEFVENVDVYADGLSGKLNNRAMIKNSKMFIPLIEIIGRLDCDLKVAFMNDKTVQLITDKAEYFIMPQYIMKKNIDKSNTLSYETSFLEDDLYIDAMFFVNELDITVTYEVRQRSAYVCSVLHYDGYRKAPTSIFTMDDVNQKYHHRYMYVDGIVVKKEAALIQVQTVDGLIFFKANSDKFVSGVKYRFCFCYLVDQYDNGIPKEGVMESCLSFEGNARGKMQYTMKSWEEIQALINKSEPEKVKAEPKKVVSPFKDAKIVEAVTAIIRQNPTVVNDRSLLIESLKDIFDNKRDLKVFADAVDVGIPVMIHNYIMKEMLIEDMVERLTEEAGIAEEYAQRAVFLWCEIYGSRVLEHEFYARNYFDENVSDMLFKRSSVWNNPILTNDREMGEIVYKIPDGWRSEAAFLYSGYYYYPYQEDADGMVWITHAKNRSGNTGDDFAYNGMISGMVKGDFDRVIATKDVTVAGIKGKRFTFFMHVGENEMQLDSYVLPTKDYVYGFHFGEKEALCNEMKNFEESFTRNVRLKGAKQCKALSEVITDNSADLDIDIDELELSVRSYNCLKRNGINNLRELCEAMLQGPERMSKIRNLGRTALAEVFGKVNELCPEVWEEYKKMESNE